MEEWPSGSATRFRAVRAYDRAEVEKYLAWVDEEKVRLNEQVVAARTRLEIAEHRLAAALELEERIGMMLLDASEQLATRRMTTNNDPLSLISLNGHAAGTHAEA